jgi:hypothetical protein
LDMGEVVLKVGGQLGLQGHALARCWVVEL